MSILPRLVEAAFLFAALGFAIPIPNSSPELYSVFPMIAFSVACFFISRLMRHGIAGAKQAFYRVSAIIFASVESILFSLFFILSHTAANMVG